MNEVYVIVNFEFLETVEVFIFEKEQDAKDFYVSLNNIGSVRVFKEKIR